MGIFTKKEKESTDTSSARERDKARVSAEKKTSAKTQAKVKRKIKRTTLDTLPYEKYISNYVMLLRSNVRVGRETMNLYSRTYYIPDINYFSLTEEQQEEIFSVYSTFLNGFDSNTSLQVSLVNGKIDIAEFSKKLLLKERGDGLDNFRREFNGILQEKIMNGQKGLHCRKYFTITTAAISLDQANDKLYNIELHMTSCLKQIGAKPVRLTSNDRVRLMTDILFSVNEHLDPISREDLNRKAEKELCCPEYFEFKRDYFMFNEKYARCLFFRKLPAIDMKDTLFKELTDLNLEMILSENVEFVEKDEAITMLRRKQTDMNQEAINKTKRASSASNGAFIDPIKGTTLEKHMIETADLIDSLESKNQKMTQVQWVIMLTAESFDELEKATDAVNTVLRAYQIESSNAPYRQEVAFASTLPVGNSNSCDKENSLQVRRTMTTESTAIFIPFNTRDLMHSSGLYYGENLLSRNIIMFDRRKLSNPNGFIFGVPGSGKSFLAKLEMIFSCLATNDEVLILDPEREYTALAEMMGGEVIYISENSKTHINPLDLTENPDKSDKEYDPIAAKLDFLLSFFSCIMGNQEVSPIQKSIIDIVMHNTYSKHHEPTFKEFYSELESFEQTADDETKSAAAYLRQTLVLYTHGSMNVFSNKSNVNINKRIVVYDIKDLGKNLQTLGMMIVLENLWDRVAKNRSRGIGTRIYIDEMYLLFKSEQSANFFYELYKRARKWGGVPTGITQNVDDLLRSALAKTMLSNTQFVVMLAQNPTDREQLSEILHISPDTMQYVNNSPSGTGLIYAGAYGTIPFDATFPSDTEIYKVISTKFGENRNASNTNQ